MLLPAKRLGKPPAAGDGMAEKNGPGSMETPRAVRMLLLSCEWCVVRDWCGSGRRATAEAKGARINALVVAPPPKDRLQVLKFLAAW